MEILKIAKIAGGQDGAVYGEELFRLDSRGRGVVYHVPTLPQDGREATPVATLRLFCDAGLVPHSNAVFFGKEKYAEGDPYPLLYTNIYNNYAGKPEPYIGVLCAFRLFCEGGGIVGRLVQTVKVGFCEDATLWRATPEAHGVRPYGNFVFDGDGSLYAFVMRNEALGTRFFRFPMPSAAAGAASAAFPGVREVTLTADDILAQLDLPLFRFVQGACFHAGRIYSTEGFTGDEKNRPAIRVVDPATATERYIDLLSLGIKEEPEMIDFSDGVCYYSDLHGTLYTVDFA